MQEQLQQLLSETGEAHHAAFSAVDGDDPEWPLWYADYLRARWPSAQGKLPTLSELTYLMVEGDRRYQAEQPDISWPTFYAAVILDYLAD